MVSMDPSHPEHSPTLTRTWPAMQGLSFPDKRVSPHCPSQGPINQPKEVHWSSPRARSGSLHQLVSINQQEGQMVGAASCQINLGHLCQCQFQALGVSQPASVEGGPGYPKSQQPHVHTLPTSVFYSPQMAYSAMPTDSTLPPDTLSLPWTCGSSHPFLLWCLYSSVLLSGLSSQHVIPTFKAFSSQLPSLTAPAMASVSSQQLSSLWSFGL